MKGESVMYYAVCVKCGHVGKNYYVDKILGIEAESGKEAAAAAKDGDLGRAARFAAAARSYASVILGRGGADSADLEDHVQKLRHAGSHESIQRLRKEYRRHR